jgi:hypothetical protein
VADWLGRIVGGRAPARAPADRLFIDDDVVAGLEILPASCAAWCRDQMAAIAAFARAHEAPNGAGWTDAYVRPPPPRRVADLAMPLAPAVAALDGLLPRIAEVVTGSTGNPQRVARAVAFGPSPLSAAVLYADAERRLVAGLEIALRGGPTEQAAVLAALGAMPAPEPLIAVDWERHRLARLADPAGRAAFVA